MTESATGHPLLQGLPKDMTSWIKHLEDLLERLLALSGASALGLETGLFRETLEKLIAHSKGLANSGGQMPTDPGAWMQWLQDSFTSVADPNKFSALMDPSSFFSQLQQTLKRGNESFNLTGTASMPQLHELLDPSYWLKASERNLRQTADLLATWQKPTQAKHED